MLSSKHQKQPAPSDADTALYRLAAFQIAECANVFGQLHNLEGLL
jgi:hypothetical protein